MWIITHAIIHNQLNEEQQQQEQDVGANTNTSIIRRHCCYTGDPLQHPTEGARHVSKIKRRRRVYGSL